MHLHCIVTGGDLSPDHQKRVSIPYRRFLFPVRVLSKVYTGKYLAAVDSLVAKAEGIAVGDRRPDPRLGFLAPTAAAIEHHPGWL